MKSQAYVVNTQVQMTEVARRNNQLIGIVDEAQQTANP
jgi:hypothetical protein